jgi:F-type H+-transporting ATPase subunit delta
MEQYVIAKRYAVALSELVPYEQWDALGEELDTVASSIDVVPQLKALLLSPIIPRAVRAQVLDKVMTKIGCREMLQQFLKFILERGRLFLLPDMRKALKAIMDERNNIARARIVSAFDLPDKDVERIIAAMHALTGKKLDASVEKDSSLIGGILVYIGNRIYDGTVKNQLAHLERSLQQV